MSYEPRPGALAYRVLAYLEKQPRGFEITSGKLAAELNVDSNGFIPHMKAPLDAGLIFRRKKDAHPRSPIFWSLVDHSAPKGAAEGACRADSDARLGVTAAPLGLKDEHAAPPPGPQTRSTLQSAWSQVKAARAMTLPADLNGHSTMASSGDATRVAAEVAMSTSKPEPKPEVEHKPIMTMRECMEAEEAKPEISTQYTRCAYWSSGECAIEAADGTVVMLATEQAKALKRFLNRVLE